MKIIDLYVVVDNKDPYNASRVRAYPLSLFDRTSANASQIVRDQDANAKYKPWEKAQGYEELTDPYCFGPFLPKHINLIPKEGDLIKVISYEDSANMPKEYLIVNSTINNIQNETYRSADKFHNNNAKRGEFDKTRTDVPGYNPNYTDFALTSGRNSDLILNDGRIILKAGHQLTTDTGARQTNLHQGTVNITQFKTGYTYQDVDTTTEEQMRIAINSIVEYRLLDYVNEPRIINSYDYKFGFNIKIKSFQSAQYIETLPNSILESPDIDILIYLNDEKKFINVFKKILRQLDKRQLDYEFNTGNFISVQADGIIYKITDNRQPVGGVMPDRSINLGKYFYIRQSQNQEFITTQGKELLANISSAITTNGGDIQPKPQGAKTLKTTTTKRNLTQTGTPETAITIGADNQFILSWKNNDYAKLNNREYITQEMIYGKGGLMDTTEPLVRGNQLLIVIAKLIDLILAHGHKDISDSRETIDNITIEDLNRIKSTILNIKNTEKQLSIEGKDINDAINNLINHNLRIN